MTAGPSAVTGTPAMPYATASDMKDRYDVRRLGDLVRDDNTRATPAELNSDTVLAEALADATSEINSAALVGRRYTIDELRALSGEDAKVLIRLTCDLAYCYLVQRRGFAEEEMGRLAPGCKSARAMLERLRLGEAVFNVEQNLNASVPVRVLLSRNVNLISSVTRVFGDLNLQGRATSK